MSSLSNAELSFSLIISLFSPKQSAFFIIFWNILANITVVLLALFKVFPLTSSSRTYIYSSSATNPLKPLSKNLIQNLIKVD
jgi:hypothetical protein